jgi:hypothetical protein
VREIGVLQGAGMEGDGARLFSLRKGDASVQPPQRRKMGVGHLLVKRIRRSAEGRTRLNEVVLKEPRFGQCRSNRDFVFAIEPARTEQGNEVWGCFDAAAALESRLGSGQGWV